MKIINISCKRLDVPLDKPFVIATGIATQAETMIVMIETDEGIIGYGEAEPSLAVTGETIETVEAVLPLLASRLIGLNPFAIERVHKIMDRIIVRNSAAKAGIDIALYDIMAKKLGMPLYALLGGDCNMVTTDMTVGIDEPQLMAAEAAKYKTAGYSVLKIKAGLDANADADAMRLIREAVGHDMRLRADANQGWSVNEAIRTIDIYEKYGVEMVEQPVKYWDVDGLAYIRRRTKIAIGADESLHTPEDAMGLAKAEAADLFNIKLMKCGGIYHALRINAIAEAAGIRVMLGCMMETRIGNTAAAALVAAQSNITEADLDSHVYFENQGITGGFYVKDGVMHLSDAPGLGVCVT